MNNPLYDLNNLELAELMLLWQCRSLLKQINEKPQHANDFVRVHFYDDDSGGLYTGYQSALVQLGDDWNNLEEAVAVMSEYLQSLG